MTGPETFDPLNFNPRSPCGGRRAFAIISGLRVGFQSTLPVWGATAWYLTKTDEDEISIHAPRVGGDALATASRSGHTDFNPRSPCGGRLSLMNVEPVTRSFQSTLPVWGATRPPRRHRCGRQYFNPRSPCGGRPQRCTDFSFASSAKRGFFVIFSKLGAIFRGWPKKAGGFPF